MKLKERVKLYIKSLKYSRLTLYDDNLHFIDTFNRLNAHIGELSREKVKLKDEMDFYKRGYFRVLRRNERARKFATSSQTNFNKSLVANILDILKGSREN